MQSTDNKNNELVSHLFRHEAGKMVAVLTRLFGFDRLEAAEDIVQDTFIQAFESWKLNGNPDNPTAWLYKAAKNKALDYVRRQQNFLKISKDLKTFLPIEYNISAEIEKAFQQISDSQLQMFFAVCHPAIPPEAQIALALKTLGGFSVEEVAKAFLTNRENIKKRLQRAKDKIRAEKIMLDFPPEDELNNRLGSVLQCIYLLFNEGYYSTGKENIIRKDLCLEAMRLCLLLIQFPKTNQPEVNALMALMCFHVSRFESRTDENGKLLALHKQDKSLWNQELISKGNYFLYQSAHTDQLTVYHLEARIAFHHTEEDNKEKWYNLLRLYDQYLKIDSQPIVILNRAFILSKVNSPEEAIKEIEHKPELENNYLYFALLGELYEKVDAKKSKDYWMKALNLSESASEQEAIKEKIK